MRKNPFGGKFIVFEGLDGSGHTTQAKLLEDFFLNKGYKVILTNEPTLESKAGRTIRKVLNKELKIEARALQKLFVQDRKEHLEKVIIPALKEKRVVICDRYFFSTVAYGTADGLDLEWLIEINNQFLLPDITFILKVRPEICVERIEGRGEEKTIFEKKEKLEIVWKVYQTFPGRFPNIYIIDGEKSINETSEQIKSFFFIKEPEATKKLGL